MKNLYVIGDSNIYGDEQLNDNLKSVANGVLGEDGEEFNYPSMRTYPYYLRLRNIKNVSLPGLSVDSQADIYMQMVLPHLKEDDELLLHLPPVSRDSIYVEWDPDTINKNDKYNIFKNWTTYSGIESSKEMFSIFCNLFSQLNVNPTRLENLKNPQEITIFLDQYYWSSVNMLNKYKNFIYLVETTSPAKNFYIFQTFNTEGFYNKNLLRPQQDEHKDRTVSLLYDMLKPLGVKINLIDDNWIQNMKDITEELCIERYPHGHFHADVHKEYCKRFVKKHFPV